MRRKIFRSTMRTQVMAKHKRASRSYSSGGKNYVWAVALIDSGLTTTPVRHQLVTDTDWEAIAGQASATVIAVRGYLAFRSIGTTLCDSAYYIGVLDGSFGSFASPGAVTTYVDEDIMWTGGLNKGAGAVEARMLHHEVINVKAKRKIKSGMDLNLILYCTVDTQVNVTGVIRTLLLKNSG